MKKLALLSLPLLLAACGGGAPAPGASVVSVTADKSAVTMTGADTTGSTTFSFTNRAGSREVTINSATVTWTDPATKTAKSETVSLAAFTLPAGLTCAAVATNPTASCSFNDAGTTFADRTLSKSISDTELFSKVLAANPSASGLPVTVQFNNASNTVPFTFTSKTSTDGGGVVTAPPSPAIIINNSSYQTNPSTPISNTLSVTVSAGVAAGVGLKQLILEVTDSKGIVDTTSYTSTQETVTFNIDTTKYPDGVLKLRAIAIDALNRRGETQAATNVTIANQVSPSIRITNPVNGSEVSGVVPVVVQFQQNNTAFTFVNNQTMIEVVDSRDQVITTQQATITKVNDGLWQATTTLDLNATQYINGTYTLRAKTDVLLAGQSTASTIMTTSTFQNVSRVDVAPALNILLPAFFDANATLRPVLTRKSAVAIQVSDSDTIQQVNVRFVCDPADVAPGQACNTNAYNYNIPVGEAGLHYRIFNTGILIDGQPFLPDGYYIMRVSATDAAGNSNIKEMKVTVNRASNGIARQGGGALNYNTVVTYENAFSKFSPAAADWFLGTKTFDQTTGMFDLNYDRTLNPTRVLTMFYDSTVNGIAREIPSAIGIDTYLDAGSTIGSGTTFGKAGTYATSFLVQDLVTGVVEFYDGQNVQVFSKD